MKDIFDVEDNDYRIIPHSRKRKDRKKDLKIKQKEKKKKKEEGIIVPQVNFLED